MCELRKFAGNAIVFGAKFDGQNCHLDGGRVKYIYTIDDATVSLVMTNFENSSFVGNISCWNQNTISELSTKFSRILLISMRRYDGATLKKKQSKNIQIPIYR